MPRHEYLYEIKAWEANRIIKGYKRRNILQYQLQRMQMWASLFCMGNPEKKSPTDIFRLYFDDFDKESGQPISDDEIREMQDMMAAINKANARKARRKKK